MMLADLKNGKRRRFLVTQLTADVTTQIEGGVNHVR